MTARKPKTAKNRLPGASPISGVPPPAAHQFKRGNQASKGHGRPRTLSELRKLIQDLGNEQLSKEGITRLEAMLRSMYLSRSAADRKEVLDRGWGKVPDETKLTGDKNAPITLRIVYGTDDPTAAASSAAIGVHSQQGEAESGHRGATRRKDDRGIHPSD